LPDISIVQFMVETHEKNSLSGANYPDMVSAYKLSSGQVRSDFDKFWNDKKDNAESKNFSVRVCMMRKICDHIASMTDHYAVVGFGEALKLLMNDRDMSVEQMESESGLSVSTVKRLRAGQDASVEQIVAISVALHLPPPVSGDLLRMCGITLDFNNQKNTVYQMILTEYYKEGIEQVNVCLAACGCAPLKTAC